MRLVCPSCRTSLERSGTSASCSGCGTSYVYAGEIPLLVAADAAHASAQAAWFDENVDVEWETERPASAPAAHRWLLEEKFRRSVRGLELAGVSALTVCGGSGMDAEFLARRGADVVSSDVSAGAVARARERARRHGVEYDLVVADAQRLPFADRAFDLAYVHDGLHHLDAPLEGLREMARVARRSVSVTEPADAAVTQLAVRLGLAEEREEAGNRVLRLSLDDVTDVLREEGFTIVHAERYGMFYRHVPGRPMRLLSSRLLFPLFRVVFRVANRLGGPFGNKLCVVAARS